MSKQLNDDAAPRPPGPPMPTALAARYLKERHALGSGKPGFLHREAWRGTGPTFFKAGLRRSYYFGRDLDEWATAKLGPPRVEADHRTKLSGEGAR